MESAILFALGILIGGFLSVFIFVKLLPSIILMKSKSKYDFNETVETLKLEVEKQGWKIPYVHDLQETMNKFGKKVDRVHVFEICKPSIAYEILSRDKERIVSAMMPCRISVYETSNGEVWISRLNGEKFGKIFGGIINQFISLAGRESEEIIARTR